MSSGKKQSSLLAFFGKSPKASPKPACESSDTPKAKITKTGSGVKFSAPMKQSLSCNENMDTDEQNDMQVVMTPPAHKRRRVMIPSDSDNETEEEAPNVVKKVSSVKGSAKRASSDSPSVTPLSTPNTVKSSRRRVDNECTPTPVSEKTVSFLKSFRSDEAAAAEADSSVLCEQDDGVRFKHLDLKFLDPDSIRDKEKRPKSHPDYDARTLHVPDDYLRTITPAIRQWWAFKKDFFDTILFFKVGKFYELYHMDAVIAVNELNLTYMKGDYAHCGFPEIAYGRFADQLVQRGYQVGRVEQTETPNQMNERIKANGKGSSGSGKAVTREICRVTTPATQTFSFLEQNGEFAPMPTSSKPSALMAICEKDMGDGISMYGVCIVDTSTGKFQIGQFNDDEHRSHIRTAIAQNPPSEVLYERGHIGFELNAIFKGALSGSVKKEALERGSQFLSASNCLKLIRTKGYFVDGLPEFFDKMVDQKDPSKLTPSKDSELALSAFGATIWYLKRCLIDFDLVSMGNLSIYCPPDESSLYEVRESEEGWWKGRHLVLDGITLNNLNILPSESKDDQVSLINTIDFCSSPFGKRLLRHWVCSPLCEPDVIVERQEAIQALLKCPDFVKEATERLRAMPDLERALQRIHTLGLKNRAENHPDGRAIMFESDKYNKRKLNDLISVIAGFKKALELAELYNTNYASKFCDSPSLHMCLNMSDGGFFPDVTLDILHFETGFDHKKAKEEGIVEPKSGINPDYDAAIEAIAVCKENLEGYLTSQRRHLVSRKSQENSINYFGSGRNRYQLEIPDAIAERLPSDFEFKSQRKGFKRFTTPKLQGLFEQLQKDEDILDTVYKDIIRALFADFDSRYSKWKRVIDCLAAVDVLLSLTQYAESCQYTVCAPQFMCDMQPFLEIEQGVHPCLSNLIGPGKFIPNDTRISASEHDPSLLLITGANMGGKSTVMRQCALLVVLAQIGSLVPAASMRLTPVDRVFTRIGASDRILSGQSTFFVEMSETKVILRDATEHSLVIIDELGRGTATHDGTAIAYAVIKDIAERVRCRTLFSTHYHSLVSDFHKHQAVKLVHMACMVENENEDDPTAETVTFLYQMTNGPCPKSYGFHAAKLAGLSNEIIRRAHEKSRQVFPDLEKLSI